MANIELDGANKKIKVDSGDLTLDIPGDIILDADGADLTFADGGTNILKITNSSSDVVFQNQVDAKDIIFKQYDGTEVAKIDDDGSFKVANSTLGISQSSSDVIIKPLTDAKDIIFQQYDGTAVATVEDNGTFNIPASKLAIGGTAVTSTAAELNIMDGVTATAAEINLIDGGTARGTTAIADGDGVLINDAGTMRQTTVETLKTYIGSFNADAAQVFNESGADADFRIEADDTTHMFFVDASEDKIGINQSSPLATLHIRNGGADFGGDVSSGASNLCLDNSGNAGMTIASGTSNNGSIHFADSGDNDIGRIIYRHASNSLAFDANASERMRITSDGDLIVGGTALNAESALAIEVNAYNGAARLSWNRASAQGGNTSVVQEFRHATSVCGSISHDQSATVFATSSDYRLKENVDYDFDATTRLKQLKPARFNFKVDKDEDGKVTKTLDGFLAHEVSNVVPQAVIGEKDKTKSESKVVSDANGNVLALGIEEADWTKGKTDGTYDSNTTWDATKTVPVYQGIDQAKLVPLLVKTVQELEARIKTLEDA